MNKAVRAVDGKSLQVFETLAANQSLSKSIRRTAKALAQNYKPSITKQLKSARDLAYELYFVGEEKAALSVTSLLGVEEFARDFNLWTPIQGALSLEAHLLRRAGESDVRVATKLRSVVEFDWGDDLKNSVNRKTHARVMDGALLNSAKIARAREDGDASRELALRETELSQLFFMRAMGGSVAKPLAWLDSEISQNEAETRRLRDDPR